MALQALALLFALAFTLAGALRLEEGSLAKARAEAAQAVEASTQAAARAKAALQKVKDLGGGVDPDRPFWFKDIFPDPWRDGAYRGNPYKIGPTPMDDLGILYSVVKETRPRTLVEIGFWAGDGTRALLSAADPGATCYSFDPRPREGAADKLKAQAPATGRNFVFHEKSAEEITPEDVGGDKIGFVFMDADHNVTQSRIIFEKLLPMLTDDAIVAVHDTGGWGKKFLDEHTNDQDVKDWWDIMESHTSSQFPSDWPLKIHGKGDEQYYLHPHVSWERQFVNWVAKEHPDWAIMNFHSLNTLRMGVTMMQRQRTLELN